MKILLHVYEYILFLKLLFALSKYFFNCPMPKKRNEVFYFQTKFVLNLQFIEELSLYVFG